MKYIAWIILLYHVIYADEIEPFFLEAPQKIEYFIKRPVAESPYPILFFLHGGNDEGARGCLKLLDTLASYGICAVAISIPGYGDSEGPRDYVGPNSQRAVASVIRKFEMDPTIDKTRMGIYGISKGAMLASLIHKEYPGLQFQILESGCYDLLARYRQLPTYLSNILLDMEQETGGNGKALMDRSAVFQTGYMRCKTLILQGKYDDRKGLASAIKLHEILRGEGKESMLHILETTHALRNEKWNIIVPYLRAQFFDLYGVGIALEDIPPALQIIKIVPKSAAEASGQLRLGDAILRVSPNNDEEEIDTLRMPLQQCIKLILGKKGTHIRFHVQHLDLTYDDVILERR